MGAGEWPKPALAQSLSRFKSECQFILLLANLCSLEKPTKIESVQPQAF